MLISVIISNFDGSNFLPRLLNSIAAQTGVETEIVVVDRESRDESLAILARYPDVKVVSYPAEAGLCAGYSAGADVAAGRLLFFANEDLHLHPDCLRQLATQIDPARRIAAADPWQWTYDGSLWTHGVTRFRTAWWDLSSPDLRRSFDFTNDLPDGSETPLAGAGAFMIDREAFREVGGWDCSFFLDYEDVDLFLRLWQRGWRCVCVKSARVFHTANSANTKTTREGIVVPYRRYASGRSNLHAIAVKYYSRRALAQSVAIWPVILLNNLVKGRWRRAGLDLLVLADLARRWPALAKYRRSHRSWNLRHPGEQFFRDSQFQSPPISN